MPASNSPSQCHCGREGDKYNLYGLAPDNECAACPDDGAYRCGGGNRMAIYKGRHRRTGPFPLEGTTFFCPNLSSLPEKSKMFEQCIYVAHGERVYKESSSFELIGYGDITKVGVGVGIPHPRWGFYFYFILFFILFFLGVLNTGFWCIIPGGPKKRNSRYSRFFRTLLWSTVIFFHLAG